MSPESPTATQPDLPSAYRRFVALNGLLALVHVRSYWGAAFQVEGPARLLLPLALVAHLEALVLLLALALLPAARRSTRRLLLLVSAPLAFATLHALLFVDARVYGLFRFHLNSIAVDAVLSPGGFEAMGFGRAQVIAASLSFLGVLAAEAAALAWLVRRPGRVRAGWVKAAAATVLALMLAQLGSYRLAEARRRWDVLRAQTAVPLHLVRLAEECQDALGFGPSRSEAISIRKQLRLGAPSYPLAPVRFVQPASRPTILWVIADGWRSDAMDPRLTPRIWELAGRSLVFANHVSGGIETRLGTFSLFYGLPGPYFDPFLKARRGPILLTRLEALGYELHFISATGLDYLGASSTFLADVQAKVDDSFRGTQDERDLAAAERAAAVLATPSQRPRLVVLSLASTHVPYSFPPAYAQNVPFAGSDFVVTTPQSPAPIHNRYLNAVAWTDHVVGWLLDEARRPLAEAVILLTSDHGQEFLEHGAWLHGSALHPEQYRVPLLLRVPGVPPAVVAGLTSHVDVVPTLLQLLGADGPPSDYSTGRSLLRGTAAASALTCSRLQCAVVDGAGSLAVFPNDAGSFDAFDREGHPDGDRESRQVLRRHVTEALHDLGRFLR